MFHRKSLIWPLAVMQGIGLVLGGCVAYGPSAGYPAPPYGYGAYSGYSGYYGGYAPGYGYPPGYTYAPGFFGSALDFGSGRRWHREHDDRRGDPDRIHRGGAAEQRGRGPIAHPPGPVHAAPAGRPPAPSGQTMRPHSAAQGRGGAQGHGSSGDGQTSRN